MMAHVRYSILPMCDSSARIVDPWWQFLQRYWTPKRLNVLRNNTIIKCSNHNTEMENKIIISQLLKELKIRKGLPNSSKPRERKLGEELQINLYQRLAFFHQLNPKYGKRFTKIILLISWFIILRGRTKLFPNF